ncbi:sigma-70 family RNA polymerase sigma factor [Plantactinospora sp. GCM10030261]|uniref:sigma-70 family RNA polymerase sigma factor n=1 Tax=Plantactinospora sp. GCM10030261 TaxID=3273420 RepID=UPI003607CCF2
MDDEWLADRFEPHRARLRAVAHRMLGSSGEAEDAVQETWLRLARTEADGVTNLGGWLTTVIGRVCLDMLRSRTARREDPLDARDEIARPTTNARPVAADEPVDPEQEALLADSIGAALLVVLDTLSPAERLAFVLHDLFAVPFDQIAPILGRSPDATKMLASRARRRVRQTGGPEPAEEPDSLGRPDRDPERQRQVVGAFLAAARDGDFAALLAVLHPDVVARADGAAVLMGAAGEVRGAADVAGTFAGRARAAQPAMVDGRAGALWTHAGRPRVVFAFTVAHGQITAIDLIADADHLTRLDLVALHR